MPVAYVQRFATANNKTAGATNLTISGNAAASVAGNTLVLFVIFDNFTTASQPIVSSIGKPAGETAEWVFLGAARSTSVSGGAFASGEIWAIKTTVSWPTATAYTITLSNSVTQKAHEVHEFSGASAIQRSTAGSAYSTTTTAASAASTGVAPVVGDLAVGMIFQSNAATAPAGDTDTTGGAWLFPTGSLGSTGGSGATNNYGLALYKVVTSTSHQTLDNSAALTAGNGAIVAILQPEFTAGYVASSANGGNSTTASVVLPTGIVAGDHILVMVTRNDAAYSTSTPSGYTLLGQQTDGDCWTALYAKATAVAGDNGATVTFTAAALAAKWCVIAWVGRGGHPSNPIAQTDWLAEGATDATHNSPGLQIGSVGSCYVGFIAEQGGGTLAWTPPATLNFRNSNYQSGGGPIAAGVGDYQPGVTGGSGGKVWTQDAGTSPDAIGWAIEIMPRGAPANVQAGVAQASGSASAGSTVTAPNAWTKPTSYSGDYRNGAMSDDGSQICFINNGGTTLSYSLNGGQTWATKTLPAGAWLDIAYGNGYWVITGYTTGTFTPVVTAYATDPSGTWTTFTIGWGANSGSNAHIAYGNGWWVITNDRNFEVAYINGNPTGIWTVVSSTTMWGTASIAVNTIVWFPQSNTWVVGTSFSQANFFKAGSPVGTWTSTGNTDVMNIIEFDGTTYASVGNNTNYNTATVLTSWTSRAMPSGWDASFSVFGLMYDQVGNWWMGGVKAGNLPQVYKTTTVATPASWVSQATPGISSSSAIYSATSLPGKFAAMQSSGGYVLYGFNAYRTVANIKPNAGVATSVGSALQPTVSIVTGGAAETIGPLAYL